MRYPTSQIGGGVASRGGSLVALRKPVRRQIPPGMSTDAFMRGLHGAPADEFVHERLLVVRCMAVVALGLMIGGLCTYAVGPDTHNPSVRSSLPVVDVGFAHLLQERHEGLASFSARYSGRLFRLQGMAVDASAPVWRDGSRPVTAPSLTIAAPGAIATYTAVFLQGDAAAVAKVTPGSPVTILCDHLEVRRAQRMEGCTLTSAISDLPSEPHPTRPLRPHI